MAWMRDIEAHCSACGLEGIRRYYSATPFHSLTCRRLESLLTMAPEALDGRCEQCDAPFGPGDAVRWVVHYGFPSGRGLIQGFGAPSVERRWLLSPHDAFDVQLVPCFFPAEDAANVSLDALSVEAVEAAFGRCLNPKEEARRFVADGAAAAGPRQRRLACGLWVATVPSGSGAIALRVRGEEGHDDEDHVIVPLCVAGVPLAGFPGAPAEWLDSAPADVDVFGVAAPSVVETAVRDIVETFPIEMTPVAEERSSLRLVLPDRDVRRDDPLLSTAEMAYEAARGLVAPGDIARLEIDRVLHALTGLSGCEEEVGPGVNG